MELIEIQRLVDGELPKAERTVLLKRLDSMPEYWRTVALSFIEEQSFRDGIRSLNQASTHHPVSAIEQNEFSNLRETKEVERNPSISRDSNKPWFAMALAASFMLLVGFSFGRMVSFKSNSRNDSNYALGKNQLNDSTNALATRTPDALPNDKPNEHTIDEWGRPIGQLTFAADGTLTPSAFVSEEFPNAMNTQLETAIPIYEVKADQAKRWMDAESQRVSAWRDSLRQQGYELQLRPQRIEKQLPDGRSLIVPVNQWNVRPFGQ